MKASPYETLFPPITVIVGDVGNGKTALAEAAMRSGLPNATTPDCGPLRPYHANISKYLVDQCPGETRERYGELADAITRTHGPDVWCRIAVTQHVRYKDLFNGIFITGPRRISEIKAAKAPPYNATVIGLKTPWSVVRERYKATKIYQAQQAGRRLDQTFFAALALETAALQQRRTQENLGRTSGGYDGINIRAVYKLADFIITNAAPLTQLSCWSQPTR